MNVYIHRLGDYGTRIYRGYQMSVGLILTLLNKLNGSIEARIILFYSTSSINLVMDLHEFNSLFMTYAQMVKKIILKYNANV